MISVVIPAFRESARIRATVAAVRGAAEKLDEPVEVIVVDDGSDDDTAEQVEAEAGCSGVQVFRSDTREAGDGVQEAADAGPLSTGPPEDLNTALSLRVVRLEQNQGKGAALSRGLSEATGELIVMLDADLGETAAEFPSLLAPVRAREADLTIGVICAPKAETGRRGDGERGRRGDGESGSGGFGLALRAARWGVARLTGRVLQAPLSGQRAFAARHVPLLTPLEPGFGLEVGMDIDALRAGLRVLEVPTTMAHAATGRDWAGFRHRGRQFLHILRALARRALRSAAVRGVLGCRRPS